MNDDGIILIDALYSTLNCQYNIVFAPKFRREVNIKNIT